MMNDLNEYSSTYEILEQLGEGGGGIVYKAYHKRLRTYVVLKKMKVKSRADLVNRKEVDILKNLSHSYLPQVIDFLPVGDQIYTVMSYIPGKSLKQLIDEGNTFTEKQLTRWGMQLLSALNYLHSQKPTIIHGDIKPANIMLTPEGNICLIDFNISFFLDDTTILGYTNGYSSPEQYAFVVSNSSNYSAGKYSINEKSDIYSAGATLYYLATGLKRINFNTPVDIEVLVDATSEAFAQVIVRAMKNNPGQRYESAYQMFRALQEIPQKDQRYRNLLRRQSAIRSCLVLLMVASIGLGGFGVYKMQLERTDKYNTLVEKQIACRQMQDYEQEDENFQEAKALMPTVLETYFQKAYTWYAQKKYEECVAFINYDILQNPEIEQEQRRMADVYYLQGDSYFQLEKYEEATEAFAQVIILGTLDAVHYRDYAISLAYVGEIQKSENILQNAIDYGLEDDSIFYAKGEIEKALCNWDAALENFEKCIEITKDENLKARAYALASKIYENLNERESERQLLLRAEAELPEENQILILERLIQADIDLAESTGNNGYRAEAIEKLKRVIDCGWDTYDTYDTLTVLYEKQQQLEQVEETLQKMLELYGEDYNIYKRLAFLEIDKQEALGNRSRQYENFAMYYKKAQQMYEEQLQNNNTDLEMELLGNVYRQVKEGGWLS